MNRLIIIGNGFDIAHGLKTQYKDFISHYWSKINDTNYSDKFLSFSAPPGFLNRGLKFSSSFNLKSLINFFSTKGMPLTKSESNFYLSGTGHILLEFKNNFFCRINERYDNTDWVNIEMEYYSSLKRILTREKSQSQTSDEFERESLQQIKTLNTEIEEIISAFSQYLTSEVASKTESRIHSPLISLFENGILNKIDENFFFDEFPKKFIDKGIKTQYHNDRSRFLSVKKYNATCVLNFNYTDTPSYYLKKLKEKPLLFNIHGELGNPNNPINLGFGDERDNFYSTIEDHNENEYLRFMKSFHYTNNNNYKSLIDFIEGDDFQVQIMGHSCGLSDRTLLNAIFEHANCQSIKVFYHQYEKPQNGEVNNYSEVIKNISRHFTQKRMMRDKIVNRDRCKPLPQNTK